MLTNLKRIPIIVFILAILTTWIYLFLIKREKINISELQIDKKISQSSIPKLSDSVAITIAKKFFDLLKPKKNLLLPLHGNPGHIEQIEWNDQYVVINAANKILIYNQFDSLTNLIESNELNKKFGYISKIRIVNDKVIFLDESLNSLYIYQTNGKFEKKIKIKNYLPEKTPFSVSNFEVIENHCAVLADLYDLENSRYVKYVIVYINLESFESKIFDILEIDASTELSGINMTRYGKYILFSFPLYETIYCFDINNPSVSIFVHLPYDNRSYLQQLTIYDITSDQHSELLTKLINDKDLYIIDKIYSVDDILIISGNQFKIVYNNGYKLKLIDVINNPDLEEHFLESQTKFLMKNNFPAYAVLLNANNSFYAWEFLEKEQNFYINVTIFNFNF